MIPIYEQGGGHGIGHQLGGFLERFEEICRQHRDQGRAKTFAFIFYDFHNEAIRKILRDQGAFARLDRLSGKDLSIFYLHAAAKERTVERFNRAFVERLGLQDVKPPCVIFFKLSDNGLTDISAATLESADLIHGLNELHQIIEVYIGQRQQLHQKDPKSIGYLRSATKLISVDAAHEIIKHILDHLPF